jgi:hypothetical protein
MDPKISIKKKAGISNMPLKPKDSSSWQTRVIMKKVVLFYRK